MTLIYQHWMVGGTGVTNFDLKESSIYEEAVRQYGDPNLVVSTQPLPPMLVGSSCGSLHCTRKTANLSGFWNLFRSLKETGIVQSIDSPIKAYERAMKGIK